MRSGRPAAVASWLCAAVAGFAIAGALALLYVDRTLFDSDGFADRVAATLDKPVVRTTIARRISNEIIRARPDLLAVRLLVERAALEAVETGAFRSLVQGGARSVHRSAFDRDASSVALGVVDAGLLVSEALRQVRPDLASRIPPQTPARLAAVSDGTAADGLHLLQRVEQVRLARWALLAVALVFAVLALAAAADRRTGTLRLGVGVAAAGGLLALAAGLGPMLITEPQVDEATLQAVLETWMRPLAAYGLALCAAGVVVALAAASVLRPVALLPALRRLAARAGTPAADPRRQAGLACVAIAVGGLMVAQPRMVVDVVIVVAGVLLALVGLTELLRLAAATERRGAAPDPTQDRPSARRRLVRVGAVGALAFAGIAAAGAIAGDADVTVPRAGRCNGHAALCDRTLDRVAFVATHNAMAADREPGWLFPAQDAGIDAQLRDGVRALLIDTHHGFQTPRGVATDLSGPTKSRGKLVDELGERFVASAERLRERLGYTGGGTRETFLCHGFCEVGATRARAALEVVHRFLVTHPEEVLVLGIEDDTSAAETAKVIEQSGLIREVYRGPVTPPWPTLREMIDRDERVLVLAEEHGDDGPSWMHPMPEVVQETPYAFPTVASLAPPPSCVPNRGGTAGSLFLVNHWVDTPPAPRTSIAGVVNAAGFLGDRVAACRRQRGMLPNLVAIDFYRVGDVFAVVDELNRVR